MATFILKSKLFFLDENGNVITGASGKARVLGVGASLGTVGLSTASLLGKRSNENGKKNQ